MSKMLGEIHQINDIGELFMKEGFGLHPEWARSYLNQYNAYHRGQASHPMRNQRPTADFFNPLHPEVYVFPRDQVIYFYTDEFEEFLHDHSIIRLPFSSTDFHADDEREGVFKDLLASPAFHRLGFISQLGYLVPEKDQSDKKYKKIFYITPTFPHTRWRHSLLTAILMEIVLSRNGYSRKERAPAVLAAGCHDIATPAGGDPVMRISPKLSEEENFSLVLRRTGLGEEWRKKYGFNLRLASRWVRGERLIGRLLDVLDKIAYTALDCYGLGFQKNCTVRQYCQNYPLVFDVWQDIKIARDKLYFMNPQKLYDFLLLRAYECRDLLYNPYCRALDFFLTEKVNQLYHRGILTRNKLLAMQNNELEWVLAGYFPEDCQPYICPDEYGWEKFNTAEEQARFIKKVGAALDHAECIKGFKTGLDWQVMNEGSVCSLEEVVSVEQVDELKRVEKSTQGYYVYYKL